MSTMNHAEDNALPVLHDTAAADELLGSKEWPSYGFFWRHWPENLQVLAAAENGPDAWWLFGVLSAFEDKGSIFRISTDSSAIPPEMQHWSPKRLEQARDLLVAADFLIELDCTVRYLGEPPDFGFSLMDMDARR